MEKMNCDIIRDLIPSYVDEVCSQATKECVEAHLDECGECRLIAARLRNSALSGEKLEQKGLEFCWFWLSMALNFSLPTTQVMSFSTVPGYWRQSASLPFLPPAWGAGIPGLPAGRPICAGCFPLS